MQSCWKKPPMLESAIEKRLVSRVENELGGLAIKLVEDGKRGWPDRTVILPGGRVVFVELKRKRGRLSHQQEARLDQLKAMGHHTYTAWSNEDVDALLITLRRMD